jgi:formylglycine-generating enzyme required for sulfatase activity
MVTSVAQFHVDTKLDKDRTMRVCLLAMVLLFAPHLSFSDPISNELILVPAGTFLMGDGVALCGMDEHVVTLTNDFYLGQHEVTNLEYLEALQWAYDNGYVTASTALVRDNLDGSNEHLINLHYEYAEIQFDGVDCFNLRQAPSGYADYAYPEGYDPAFHPVKQLTWFGAARYCDWLSLRASLPRAYQHNGDWACNNGDPYGASGFRLPTDAEWEYAAQFNDDRLYPWGDEDPDCSKANFDASTDDIFDWCIRWTTPVGSYQNAPLSLGLSDMAGNMKEYCNDWYVCDLGLIPTTNPPGPNDTSWARVVRDGSWGGVRNSARLRCASRSYCFPVNYSPGTGIRICKTATFIGSGIEEDPLIPRPYLDLNQPNPFTGVTRITFNVPQEVNFSLVVYDSSGRLVRILITEQETGEYTASWDGKDDKGNDVEAGTYFYRLTVDGKSVSKKMVLIR